MNCAYTPDHVAGRPPRARARRRTIIWANRAYATDETYRLCVARADLPCPPGGRPQYDRRNVQELRDFRESPDEDRASAGQAWLCLDIKRQGRWVEPRASAGPNQPWRGRAQYRGDASRRRVSCERLRRELPAVSGV